MADSIQVDLAELGRLAKAAGADFGSLAATVQQFGRTMNADLKQARRLLKESAGNIDIVRTALKGAGVSTRDTTMLIQQLNRELDKGRQLAMGFGGAWKQAVYQAFGPTAGKAVDGVVGPVLAELTGEMADVVQEGGEGEDGRRIFQVGKKESGMNPHITLGMMFRGLGATSHFEKLGNPNSQEA